MKDKYILRPWRLRDTESLADNANNINVWNNLRDSFPHPYTENDAREFITYAIKKTYTQDFAIEIEGCAVGGIGFIPGTDIEKLSAELGYWLGEPYWKKGVMSLAVKEAIDYIFSETEIIRLYATVFSQNQASINVLKKNRFHKVGTLHKAAVKNGVIIDLTYYELVK